MGESRAGTPVGSGSGRRQRPRAVQQRGHVAQQPFAVGEEGDRRDAHGAQRVPEGLRHHRGQAADVLLVLLVVDRVPALPDQAQLGAEGRYRPARRILLAAEAADTRSGRRVLV